MFASPEQLYMTQEKLIGKLQGNNGSSNMKATKAERPHYYNNEKLKRSKKAQLHESGQFSPTTSKLIKHFLSKQKNSQALMDINKTCLKNFQKN